jgi:hypothetical protein
MSMVWAPRVIGRFFCVVSALVVSSAGLAETSGFAVSDNGFPTYTYPISVPPGIGGMKPDLTLSYVGNPTAGGALGTGWSLKGVSTITRCSTVRATDGKRSDYHYVVTDKLCLDGQRLIQTNADGQITTAVASQTNDSLGLGSGDVREYRTEIDNFSRIRAYGSANGTSSDGPAYFKVWTKDGRVYEYGTNPNGNANAAIAAQGRTTIATWALSRISDLHGNYIDFKYEVRDTAWGTGPTTGPLTGREWNLLEVQYTGNNDQVPTKKIVFQYTDRADYPISTGLMQDRSESYHDGSKYVSIRLLQAIRTYINSPNPTSLGAAQNAVEVSVIKLGYDNGAVTNRSRLISITRCAGASESKCVQPVKFSYSAGGNERYVEATGYNLGGMVFNLTGEGGFSTGTGAVVEDLYGDGRKGLIFYTDYYNLSTVYYRSDVSGVFTKDEHFQYPLSANIMGQDIGGTPYGGDTIIDVDGDGIPDIIDYKLIYYHARGDGTYDAGKSIANIAAIGNGLTGANRFKRQATCTGAQNTGSGDCLSWPAGDIRYIFDVDGDGLPDIITTHIPGNSPMVAAYTLTGTPTDMATLEPYCLQTAWGGCNTHVYHGNGDGTFTEIPTNMANWTMFTHSAQIKPLTDSGLLDISGNTYSFPMYLGPNNVSSTISIAWLSQGDGNFTPAWSAAIPNSGPTSSCLGTNGLFCFDSDGSGLLSSGGIATSYNVYYGVWARYVSGNWGTRSGNFAYAHNTGSYVYAMSGPWAQFSQETNIPYSEVVKAPITLATLPNASALVQNVYGLTVIDANGDGRDDFIRWSDDPTENALYLSRGDGTYLKSSVFGLNGADNQLTRSDGSANMEIGNFTGNDDYEILASNNAAIDPTGFDKDNPTTEFTPIAGSTAVGSRLYVRADTSTADLLQTVTGETGLVTRISYSKLGNSNGRYTAQAGSYPNAAMAKNWDVVTTVTQDSGVGTGTITTDYSYKGLKGNLQGRGMLGFSEVRKQSQGADGSLLSSATRYLQDYPYIGKVASTATWAGTMDQSSPTLLSYSAQAYCDQSLSTQSSLSVPGATTGAGLPALPGLCASTQALAKPYIQSQLQQQTDLNGTVMPSTTTSYTQTACGDPSTVAQTRSGTIAGGQTQTLTSTTSNSYFADNTAGDNWLRCKVSQSTVQNSTTNPLPNLGTGAGSALYASATQGQPNTIQLSASPASIIMNLQDPGAFSQSVTLSPSGTYTAPLTYTATKQSGATSLVNVSAGATTTFSANLSNYGQSISETYRIKAVDYRQHWGYIDIPVQFSVSKKATSLGVSAPASTGYAQGTTITANVSGASPTGSVTFTDSIVGQLGVVTLSSGAAAISPSFTTPGVHTISINYSGDSANAANTTSVTMTVNKQVPVLTLSASQSTAMSGQSITLVGTLSNAVSPGGTITFYDNGSTIGSATVSSAQASATVSLSATGTHTLTATYGGDANNNAATSAGISEAVVAPLTVSLSPGATYTEFINTVGHASSCSGSALVTATAAGGAGQYVYAWQRTKADANFNLSVSSPQPNMIYLVGSVSKGHTATNIFTLTVSDTGVPNSTPVSTTVTVGIHCESSIQ